MITIVTVGVLGYVFIEGWPVFDALYMTITTLTTVGFGEIHPLSPLGRGFTIFLIVVGVGGVLYVLTTVMQYVVEGHFGGAVWRRRMKRQIEQLKDHYILCGYGRVGKHIATEFQREGVPFVVIDINQDSLRRCGEEGCLFVPGDATTDEVLRSAGIERARGLVAAIDNDAHNVYVTLSARGLRPDLFIVARANKEGSEAKLQRAGADRVISPYNIGGHRMAMSALRPVVIDFIDTVMYRGNLELLLESLEIKEDSPFIGMTMAEARAREANAAAVLAVQKKSGKMVVSTEADACIEVGDHIIVIGTPTQLKELENAGVSVKAGANASYPGKLSR